MRAYKLELLILDFDEAGSEIKDIIENQKYPNYCISPTVMNIQVAEIGEWNDKHPLNQKDKQLDFYNRLFDTNKG